MILTVGQGQQFSSIQHAINYIAAWLGSLGNTTLTDTVKIEVYSGVYGGFIVQPSTIFPTSTYRLIIQAKPGHDVTLSGFITNPTLGHGSRMVGIGIGDNTPYVTLRGLKVENFHKGIYRFQIPARNY